MLKLRSFDHMFLAMLSAAFGRLCVETPVVERVINGGEYQPPSGGCVLKRKLAWEMASIQGQPPSGGCVLKQRYDDCRENF